MKSFALTNVSTGHADGDSDLLNVAIRELKEETGVKNVKVIGDNPLSLEIMGVDGHIKRGKYVSSHEHLNVTYLMEVDENEVTRIKEDENSGVRWINVDEIKDAVTEKWVLEKIYNKEINKVKGFQKQSK